VAVSEWLSSTKHAELELGDTWKPRGLGQSPPRANCLRRWAYDLGGPDDSAGVAGCGAAVAVCLAPPGQKGVLSMRTICAWCGKVLREGPGDRVSHGICRRCMAEQLASALGVTPGQALADMLRDRRAT